jgi:hypothetical protein
VDREEAGGGRWRTVEPWRRHTDEPSGDAPWRRAVAPGGSPVPMAGGTAPVPTAAARYQSRWRWICARDSGARGKVGRNMRFFQNAEAESRFE